MWYLQKHELQASLFNWKVITWRCVQFFIQILIYQIWHLFVNLIYVVYSIMQIAIIMMSKQGTPVCSWTAAPKLVKESGHVRLKCKRCHRHEVVSITLFFWPKI